MKRYKKITPEGTRDLLFEECQARRIVEQKLSEGFASHGFHEVVTPGLEFYDVFDPEYSGIGQEVMYKLTDQRGRLVVMRPDATLPIARLTATRLQNSPRPLRLFYTQPIYRSNPNLTGRSDEVVQTGVELLGAGGKRADLEVIMMAVESLQSCVPDFRLEIGHAGFFRALAQQLPVSEDVREDIRRSIEAKNYPALDMILDTLGDTPSANAIRKLPRLFGGEEVFAEAAALCVGEQPAETLAYLKELYESLTKLGLGDRIIIDLGLVQRNDYYTGVVFSGYVEDYGDALLNGGRYDNLLGCFDSPMSAIGFAVNVDAISKLLLEQGKVGVPEPPELLIHSEDGFEMEGLSYMARQVAEGRCCEYSVFATREEAQESAKQRGIPTLVIVGNTIETLKL